MKKTFLFAVLYSVLGLICPALIQAQDIHVNCATVNPCTLTPAGGIAWAQQNPVWIFSPTNPASSILIYVHNNNTTSAHTQTVKVFQTGFARTTAPTLTSNADLWVQDAVTNNSTVSANCNSVAANTPGTPGASGVGTCYVVSMYAAQVAIQVTGTSLQAGSPDTYDLSIVQQTGYISGPQPGEDSSAGGGTILDVVSGNIGDAQVGSSGKLLVCTFNPCIPGFAGMLLNSTVWNRPQAYNGNTGSNTGVAGAGIFLFPGGAGAVSSAKSQSSTNAALSNVAGSTLPGVGVETAPATWTVPVQAASASQCSASIAASPGFQHCAVGVQMCTVATAAETQLFINLRDGASGAGTVKWNAIIAGTAGTSQCVIHEFSGGVICGTANTAMTLELSAATPATDGCASTLRGYDIQ